MTCSLGFTEECEAKLRDGETIYESDHSYEVCVEMFKKESSKSKSIERSSKTFTNGPWMAMQTWMKPGNPKNQPIFGI